MKPITIRMAEPGELGSNTFYVEQDGKTAVALSWDEMLGQIAALTLNDAVRDRIHRYGGLYRMQTAEDLAEDAARRKREDDEAIPADDDIPW